MKKSAIQSIFILLLFFTISSYILFEVFRYLRIPYIKAILIDCKFYLTIFSAIILFIWKGVLGISFESSNKRKAIVLLFYLFFSLFAISFSCYIYFLFKWVPIKTLFYIAFPFLFLITSTILLIFYKTIKNSWS